MAADLPHVSKVPCTYHCLHALCMKASLACVALSSESFVTTTLDTNFPIPGCIGNCMTQVPSRTPASLAKQTLQTRAHQHDCFVKIPAQLPPAVVRCCVAAGVLLLLTLYRPVMQVHEDIDVIHARTPAACVDQPQECIASYPWHSS